MPNCPPLYVSAPVVEPYSFGLFSVLQTPATSDPHWRCGVQWEPLTCTPARAYPIDQCPPPDPVPTKEVDDEVPLGEATGFVIYDGYRCRLPGRSEEQEVRDRAVQSLLLGEQRAVEAAFWTGSAGNTPHLASPDANVLNAVNPPTVADALSMPSALAALEECAGTSYAGQPVIHAPRGASAIMAAHQLLQRSGSRLTSWAGTPIAFYGGSPNTGPDGTAAPDGTMWLYITSPVMAYRSEVAVYPDTLAQALNRTTNEVFIVAEREWVLGFDCLHCAVLAKIC